jgi:hypothetical protein
MRNERVLVVLVASPSDLEPERNRLEEVIRELNLTWSRTFRLRLELVRWETHGYPGMGPDPQDVLNREISDDPDIFIGLMWGRYGTPTGRAGSGTEEEFARALSRYRKDPKSVRIMFYFKDAPLSPSTIDPDQLLRVQRFRMSLGSEGGLYWKFVTVEEFERLLRLHLARQIQELQATVPSPASVKASLTEAPGPSPAEDELGLLDFLELVEEYFGTLTEINERIARETSSLAQKMQERTHEMNVATAQAQGKLNPREARVLIDKAAGDMMQYVARMNAEIPLFRELLRKGADAAGRAALLSAGMASEDRRQVREIRVALAAFRDALGTAYDSTDSFRATVQGLPRMTAVLNKAKRETAAVLQDVLESLAEGRRVTAETVKALDALLGDGQQDA